VEAYHGIPHDARERLGDGMKTRILLAVLSVAVAAVPTGTAHQQNDPGPSLEAYQGLGAWLDIYNARLWRKPEPVLDDLAARGVRTLYLQTTNYRRRGPFYFPGAMGRILEGAHARGIQVVAWYLPDFVGLKRDLRWSLAAIRYKSPSGQQFDSFGLDIESSEVNKYWVRTRRLLELSSAIRGAVGPDYPLAAIIPSPRGMELRPEYWPGFPFARLAGIYDVFMTMTYYSYRAYGSRAVHDYITRSMDILRRKTRRPDVPIHAIGGIADGSNGSETLGFVQAVREYGLIGASLYDYKITGAEDWKALAQLQPTPAQTPTMPFKLWRHLDAFGNIPNADRTHPAEVVFATNPLAGAREVDVEVYDVGADEVDLYVNWHHVATLPPGPAGAWSQRTTVAIPDARLHNARPNVLAFVARSRYPNWSVWGVRAVTLMPSPLPLTDLEPHGALPGAGVRWADRVTYTFESTGAPVSITATGYDIAAEEVEVVLNGQVIGKLKATADATWGTAQTFALSAPPLQPGQNRLTFDNVANPSGRQAWGVQLISVS
jgi:hypothetical protein